MAHEPFYVLDNELRASDRISKCFCSYDRLVVVKENDRRRGKLTFLIGDGDRVAMFVEPGDAGVCGSKVDTDRLSLVHGFTLVADNTQLAMQFFDGFC